jgi:hypothetical protein
MQSFRKEKRMAWNEQQMLSKFLFQTLVFEGWKGGRIFTCESRWGHNVF